MNIYYKKQKTMAKGNSFLFQGSSKNNIPRSTFDFSKTNSDTMNFGEIKIGQWFETMAKDSIRGGVSESVIAQPLTAPANVRIKHVNKSFYLPNTLLWKYWNEFCLQRPDGIFSSSQVASAVKEQRPWITPSINFGMWLYPLIAFAKGYFIPTDEFAIPLSSNIDNKWYHNSSFTGWNSYNQYNTGGDYISFYGTNFLATDVQVINSYNNSTLSDESENTSEFHRSVFFSSHLEFDDSSFSGGTATISTSGYFNPFYYKNSPDFQARFFGAVYSDSDGFNSTVDIPVDSTSYSYFQSSLDTYSNGTGCVKFFFDTSSTNLQPFVLPLPSFELSRSYGFTQIGMLYYLAQSAVRLIDSLGINPNIINASQMKDLLSIEVNALPLFAYHKIYFDHFSNKSVDFGQIDFSYSNGPIFDVLTSGFQTNPLSNFYNTLHHIGVDSGVYERYREHFSTTEMANPQSSVSLGWRLPLLNLPQNFNNITEIFLDISSSLDVFRVLLGINLDSLISFNRRSESGSFSGLTSGVNSTLLPEFDIYHGLLHMQYANFAPDYFTTAQFDPTQGNEQVTVPSTITQLREANALQEFFDANQWTRSIGEWLNSHFDSYSKYVGLTDAEFLGSSETNVVISEQLQTSETSDSSALGERAGVGQGYNDSGLSSFVVGENGIFMCVHYIVLETAYINGIQKKLFAKNTYLDYPFPELSNLSPESINVLELCVPNPGNYFYFSSSGNAISGYRTQFTSPQIRTDLSASRTSVVPSGDSSVFGYTPRYSSYKFQFDEVKGEFLNSLNYWSDSRELFSRPVLGHEFINYELQYLFSNLNKIFAVVDDLISDHFLVNQMYNYEVTRSLPVIVKPSL